MSQSNKPARLTPLQPADQYAPIEGEARSILAAIIARAEARLDAAERRAGQVAA